MGRRSLEESCTLNRIINDLTNSLSRDKQIFVSDTLFPWRKSNGYILGPANIVSLLLDSWSYQLPAEAVKELMLNMKIEKQAETDLECRLVAQGLSNSRNRLGFRNWWLGLLRR